MDSIIYAIEIVDGIYPEFIRIRPNSLFASTHSQEEEQQEDELGRDRPKGRRLFTLMSGQLKGNYRNPPSITELRERSIKELKKMVEESDLDASGCVEKDDLINRLLLHYQSNKIL